MSKFKNIIRDKILNLKRFFLDNRKSSTFLVILIMSLGIYFVAFAQNEPTFTLENINVLLSTDTDVKEDKSMPNFGTLAYDINYNINSSDTEAAIPAVYVHVLVPDDFKANISGKLQENKITIDSKVYNHYILQFNPTKYGENTCKIVFSNLNQLNDETNFSPIISISLNTSISTDVKNILPDDIKTIKLTSVLDYRLKVFSGGSFKKDGKVYLPVGVMTYLPYNETTGIKGLKNVKNVEYTISNNIDTSVLTNLKVLDQTFEEYSNSAEFNKDYKINGLPITKSLSNGNITLTENNVTISNINLDLENTYGENEIDLNPEIIVITSNVFLYEVTLTSDIDYIFSATNKNLDRTSNINGTIYNSKVVGTFEPKVVFENPIDSIVSNKSKNLHYGQNFNFYVSNNYATKTNEVEGDSLDNITTYIKLDSNLKDVEVKDIFLGGENITEKYKNKIEYYKVPWETANFTVDSSATFCSNTTSSLTLEQKMNLFGGPCAIYTAFNSSKVEAKTDGITVIKFSTPITIKRGESLVFLVNSKIKDDNSLIDKKIQIVTNSTSSVSLDNNSKITYYLGSKINTSDIETIKNKDSYIKEKVCQEGTDCYDGLLGNTINILGGVINSVDSKTYINSKSEENEDIVQKLDSFYAGRDEPIVWRFLPSSSKGTSTETKTVYADIEIPKINGYEYLNFESAYIPESETSIFSEIDSESSNHFDKINCSLTSADSNGCTYEIIQNKDNIVYRFKIENTLLLPKLVSYFETNGLFFETNIDLIASTGEINLSNNFQYDLETKITEEQKIVTKSNISNNNALTNILVIRSKVANAGSLQINEEIPTSTLQTDLNQKYKYIMNSIITGEVNSVELINILPYNTETEKKFNGTYTVSINALPNNCVAYYLPFIEGIDRNVNSIKNSDNWVKYNGEELNNEEVIAIKITTTDKFDNSTRYFGGTKNGISINITPKGNQYKDYYENTFYVITNDKIYDTKSSVLSTFNRQISGIVFEDYDNDGFYSLGETILKDLNIELYKISSENFSKLEKDSAIEEYIKYGELVGEEILSTDEGYKFEKLSEGYYYVKIKFDSDYYNLADFEKIDYSLGNGATKNSKFKLGEETNFAYSKILRLNSSDSITNPNINLGLKIKQSFAVDINKYIKNIKVIKSTGTENYDYDKAKQVKLDFRDLMDTTFEVTYGFDITNTRYYPGYIGAIIEAIPQEMIFDPSLSENVGWEQVEGLLFYNGLNDTLILPDKTYSFEIKLKIPENMAGDFINIITVGDLRILETNSSTNNNQLEETISNLEIEK